MINTKDFFGRHLTLVNGQVRNIDPRLRALLEDPTGETVESVRYEALLSGLIKGDMERGYTLAGTPDLTLAKDIPLEE